MKRSKSLESLLLGRLHVIIPMITHVTLSRSQERKIGCVLWLGRDNHFRLTVNHRNAGQLKGHSESPYAVISTFWKEKLIS